MSKLNKPNQRVGCWSQGFRISTKLMFLILTTKSVYIAFLFICLFNFWSIRFLDTNFKVIDRNLFVSGKVFSCLLFVFEKCIRKLSIRFLNIRRFLKFKAQSIRLVGIRFIKTARLKSYWFEICIRFGLFAFFYECFLLTNTFP